MAASCRYSRTGRGKVLLREFGHLAPLRVTPGGCHHLDFVKAMDKVCLRGVCLLCLIGGLTGAVERGIPLDAGLRDTSDGRVWLSRFRGKPVVVIYEDRDTTE